MALMGFGDFDDMFGRVDRMMNSMMRNMFGSMGNAYDLMDGMMMPFPTVRHSTGSSLESYVHSGYPSNSYSYSSVMTMSTDRYGRPQVYEATHSTSCAPGGVKETHSSIRDSVSGYQEMSIGHHIQDRAHIMQKTRNYYTGEQEENNEYINIDEEEADSFNSEWQQRVGRYAGHHHRALPQIHHSTGRNSPEMLALPAAEGSSSAPVEVSESPVHSRSKMWNKQQKSKRNKKPYKKN